MGINCSSGTVCRIVTVMLVMLLLAAGTLPTTLAISGEAQAFIQTANELKYTVDGQLMNEELPDFSTLEAEDVGRTLTFDPPSLDFGEHQVGLPRLETVIVTNPDRKNAVRLLAIIGSTRHFHCSFFLDRTIAPGGNTSFDVVFLADTEGTFQSSLYIHTSLGNYNQRLLKYAVHGSGVRSSFRLERRLIARIPVNSSFAPLIYVHNPFSTTLQITEMYSNDGDLHLELPTTAKESERYGAQESTSDQKSKMRKSLANVWRIPPYETKPVMRARFVGRQRTNRTAYVRIRTVQKNGGGHGGERSVANTLILPLEVQVSDEPGIYVSSGSVHFGLITASAHQTQPSSRVNLTLYNSYPESIRIDSLRPVPANNALTVDFQPFRLEPNVVQQTLVASVSFDGEKIDNDKQLSGDLVLESSAERVKLHVPYEARLLRGEISFEKEQLHFLCAKDKEAVSRKLRIVNKFESSLAVFAMHIPRPYAHLFKVKRGDDPVLIEPDEGATVAEIRFQPNASHLHFQTSLYVHTNVSVFALPILVYNGRLKIIHHHPSKYDTQLDLGIAAFGEEKSVTVTIRNDNPIPVEVRKADCVCKKGSLLLLGIEEGNGTVLMKKHDLRAINRFPLTFPANHFSVWRLTIIAPEKEVIISNEILIYTNTEHFHLPTLLMVTNGSISSMPELLVLENSFPGHVSWSALRVQSTFADPLVLLDIRFLPEDGRFSYKPPPNQQPQYIYPEPEGWDVGWVYFNPRTDLAEEECYTGLDLSSSSAGQEWLQALSLDPDLTGVDQIMYSRLRQRWNTLQQSDRHLVNVTMEMDTDRVHGFLFKAQARLVWPSLLSRNHINFPLTPINNISTESFTVRNPSSEPLLVQLLPIGLHPNAKAIVDLMRQRRYGRNKKALPRNLKIHPGGVFGLELVASYRGMGPHESAEEVFGVKSSPHALSALLPAEAEMHARVAFAPNDDERHSSLILIRNNLTIIDALLLEGRGGRGRLHIGSKNEEEPVLRFDLTEHRHLRECNKLKPDDPPVWLSSFIVKRTFVLRNSGQLPVTVHDMHINDVSCKGYGFEILYCEQFKLQPNETRGISILFTPDFKSSRIQQLLSIHSNLNFSINYSLEATVPSHMLPKCLEALARPTWEPVLYYSTICGIGFLFFCVLVGIYFEADSTYYQDIRSYSYVRSGGSEVPDDSMGNGANEHYRFYDFGPLMPRSELDAKKTHLYTIPNTSAALRTCPADHQHPSGSGHGSGGGGGRSRSSSSRASTSGLTMSRINSLLRKILPSSRSTEPATLTHRALSRNTSNETSTSTQPTAVKEHQHHQVQPKNSPNLGRDRTSGTKRYDRNDGGQWNHMEKMPKGGRRKAKAKHQQPYVEQTYDNGTFASGIEVDHEAADTTKAEYPVEEVGREDGVGEVGVESGFDSSGIYKEDVSAYVVKKDGRIKLQRRTKAQLKATAKREQKERRMRGDRTGGGGGVSSSTRAENYRGYEANDSSSDADDDESPDFSGNDNEDKNSSARDDSTPESPTSEFWHQVQTRSKKNQRTGSLSSFCDQEDGGGKKTHGGDSAKEDKGSSKSLSDKQGMEGGLRHRKRAYEQHKGNLLIAQELNSSAKDNTPHAIAADVTYRALEKNVKSTDDHQPDSRVSNFGEGKKKSLQDSDSSDADKGTSGGIGVWASPSPKGLGTPLSRGRPDSHSPGLPPRLGSSASGGASSPVGAGGISGTEKHHYPYASAKYGSPPTASVGITAAPHHFSGYMPDAGVLADPARELANGSDTLGGYWPPHSLPSIAPRFPGFPQQKLRFPRAPMPPGFEQATGSFPPFSGPPTVSSGFVLPSPPPLMSLNPNMVVPSGLGPSGAMYGGISEKALKQTSMMQQLQQERKQRLSDYHRRIEKGADWPGFENLPMGTGALWEQGMDNGGAGGNVSLGAAPGAGRVRPVGTIGQKTATSTGSGEASSAATTSEDRGRQAGSGGGSSTSVRSGLGSGLAKQSTSAPGAAVGGEQGNKQEPVWGDSAWNVLSSIWNENPPQASAASGRALGSPGPFSPARSAEGLGYDPFQGLSTIWSPEAGGKVDQQPGANAGTSGSGTPSPPQGIWEPQGFQAETTDTQK